MASLSQTYGGPETFPHERSSGTNAVALAQKLYEYCRSQNWAGWDPYDGLNSKLFRALGLSHVKAFRLAMIQALKRCPVNLRPLLMVPKKRNPKGTALFLSAIVDLTQQGIIQDQDSFLTLSEDLLKQCIRDEKRAGWGYHFDWQTRAVLVPAGTPNIICTSFAANALLDAYELVRDPRFLQTALGAAELIRHRFYRNLSPSEGCYSYFPDSQTFVHNANLLGAAFLCRVARHTGNTAMMNEPLKATRFSANRQHADGSWDYGECDRPSQRWIDNFHTGFNLCALSKIGHEAETNEFQPNLESGFDFYRKHFFAAGGAPAYYHDRIYPLDIHSASQSIITLVTLKDLREDNIVLANRTLEWTLSNMLHSKGYFYFQKHAHFVNRIPYMRWSQAWMLATLTSIIKQFRQPNPAELTSS